MRQAPGWRTRASQLRMLALTGSVSQSAPTEALPYAAAPQAERMSPRGIMAGLRVTLLLAGLLFYLYQTVSYKIGMADVAMALALVGLVLFPSGRMRLPGPLIWLGLYIVWSGVGYTRSEYPDAVWVRLVELVKVWLIALVTANALRSRSQIRFFTVFYLGCFAMYPVKGAFVNMYVYGHTLFGRAVWINLFANPNDLAALAILQLAMVSALLIAEPPGWVRWTGRLGVIVLPLLVLMTQSRGAIVALAVFALGVVIDHRRQVGLLLKLAMVGVIVALAAPSQVWERVGGLSHASEAGGLAEADPEGSAKQRFEIWKIATKIIREHPVSGVGAGAYPLAHEIYAQGEEFDPTGLGRRDTHSTYLNVLAETGVPGLIAFVGLLLSVALPARRLRRAARRPLPLSARQLFYLELGLTAFLVAGVFGSFAYLSFFYLHLMLLWAFTDVVERELNEGAQGNVAVGYPLAGWRNRRFERPGGAPLLPSS